MNNYRHAFLLSFLLGGTLIFCGCNESNDQREKAPRPVSTMVLKTASAQSEYSVAGSVKAWKKEEIGFEVSGRIIAVKEPGERIVGKAYEDNDVTAAFQNLNPEDIESVLAFISKYSFELPTPDPSDGNQPTVIARIDPTRYEIAERSALANLKASCLEVNRIAIQIADTIPSEIDSAKSAMKLASDEFDRMSRLQKQGAISQSEFDQVKNQKESAVARLKSANASSEQAKADKDASITKVQQSIQSLIDARRDRMNCNLYAAFNGQISEVDVVPGSFVSAGSPVATVQMMDPIKVEVELSPEQSREFRRRRQVPIRYNEDDKTEAPTQNAYVYLIDPSADPTTRTFTMTLLIFNKLVETEIPAEVNDVKFARTKDIWPVEISRIMKEVPDGYYLIEKNSIIEHEGKSYVHVVEDLKIRETIPTIIKVRAEQINPTKESVNFLGNWQFVLATFENKDAVTQESLIAGELEPRDEGSEWDGVSVFVDQGEQWLFRPGDLITVDLDEQTSGDGFYLPVKAVYVEGDKKYIFEEKDGIARRIEVVADVPLGRDPAQMVKISPTSGSELQSGVNIIVGGVHFLQDGDAVNGVETYVPESGSSSKASQPKPDVMDKMQEGNNQ